MTLPRQSRKPRVSLVFALASVMAFTGYATPLDHADAVERVSIDPLNGLAINGFDPVAYFTSGKPTPGLAQFSTTYKVATYRFVSAENRDRFIATPEKFVPQYGGYCAYAISLNKIADIDPDEWTIVNDSPMDHPFHLHVWGFQVVADSTNKPVPDTAQDVVMVPANGWVRVRVAFTGLTGRSLYHCHVADHSDAGLMATVNVS